MLAPVAEVEATIASIKKALECSGHDSTNETKFRLPPDRQLLPPELVALALTDQASFAWYVLRGVSSLNFNTALPDLNCDPPLLLPAMSGKPDIVAVHSLTVGHQWWSPLVTVLGNDLAGLVGEFLFPCLWVRFVANDQILGRWPLICRGVRFDPPLWVAQRIAPFSEFKIEVTLADGAIVFVDFTLTVQRLAIPAQWTKTLLNAQYALSTPQGFYLNGRFHHPAIIGCTFPCRGKVPFPVRSTCI
jgi:hypothetical protein